MSHRKKGLFCVFLFIVISALAWSAGKQESAKPGAGPQQFAGTTLKWICSAQPATDAAKAMLSDFEAQTGIKVEIDLMDEVRMLEKLQLDKSSNTKLYDLVSIESTWIDLFLRNKIIDSIDPYINDASLPVPGLDIQDYPTGLVESQCRRGGKLVMMPFGCGTSFLATRDDWFKESAIASPQTWDDVLNAAKKLTKDVNGDGKTDRYGISLRGQRGIHSVFVYYCIAQPFGLEFLDKDKKPLLNSKQAINGLQMYVDLAKTGPAGIPTWTHEEAATAFNQSLAAMYLDVSQLIPWIERELPGKIKYVQIPKVDPYPAVSTLSGWGLGIHADSKNKKAAMMFLEFVTAKRNAKKFLGLGGPAERISILSDPEMIAKNPWYKYQLERYKIAKFAWPQVVEIPEWNDILGKYVTEALTDVRTPESALKQANEEITAMMKEAGYFK